MRMTTQVSLVCSSLALCLALIGCGGDNVQRANVSAGTMPAGGSFTGVWHSPQYGELQMRQTGSNVIGEFTKDERHGRIQGTVQGDLLRFQWEEERETIPGRPTTTRGHGYFQYRVGEDDVHNVLGQWGHDESEVGGGPWNAYKDRRRQPQLSTDIGGNTSGGSGPDDDLGDLTTETEEDYNTDSYNSGGGGGGGDDELGDL